MKYRILVMNGQKIVQAEEGGAWVNQKVGKAGLLKPGIYNLHMAHEADKSKRYDGVIIHTDDDRIYQKEGKNIVVHSRKDCDIMIEIGSAKSIKYDTNGRVTVSSVDSAKLKRGRSR